LPKIHLRLPRKLAGVFGLDMPAVVICILLRLSGMVLAVLLTFVLLNIVKVSVYKFF
jgi:hypothetical protein